MVLEPPNASQGRIAAINTWLAPNDCNPDGFAGPDMDQLIAHTVMWSTYWDKTGVGVWNDDIEQDLNCNGIDADEEEEVDLSSDDC